MATIRRSIPSLGALSTFEAAARLESFTLAAAELGVTQAAVSRQIKALEEELNTPLFLRAHRKVTLTTAGAALAGTLSQSFSRIAEVIETLRQPRLTDTVTVGATLAFTHFWLLPRLSDFRRTFPEVRLKLVADDAATDLRRDRLDVVVRYDTPPFDDARSMASLPDEVFPVCSPALLAARGMTAAGADLTALPLIASDWLNPRWMTWRMWERAAGLAGGALGRASDASTLRFNHYTDTVQAAVNGEGVALGWSVLLADLLADGKLVPLGPARVMPVERHHVLTLAGRDPAPGAVAFLDWIARRFLTEA